MDRDSHGMRNERPIWRKSAPDDVWAMGQLLCWNRRPGGEKQADGVDNTAWSAACLLTASSLRNPWAFRAKTWQLLTASVRTTEFAPALPSPSPHTAPASGYAPPQVGSAWKADRFSGHDFALQPDGTLQCSASQTLLPHEQRPEADGSLRVVYGASIRSCRSYQLREQCQWHGSATAKPRQVSVLLHPLPVGAAPLLWRYSRRRAHRHACMQLVRHQRLEMSLSPPAATSLLPLTDVILSRAQRARYRLGWQERLARHARDSTARPVTIRLFGVPAAFAISLGLATV